MIMSIKTMKLDPLRILWFLLCFVGLGITMTFVIETFYLLHFTFSWFTHLYDMMYNMR